MIAGGLFDGIGLLAYGLHLAGIQHAWLCEVDPWRRSILQQRWPGVPVFDDVRAVGARSAQRVELVAGGFPCKGVSTAGKQNGFDHPETVLWREMARAVGELRPRYVLVENVANILALHDGAVWGEVLGDLAALGYDVEWDCIPAAAVGAPHLRDRVFAVAHHSDGMAGKAPLALDGRPGALARPSAVERAERPDRGAAADACGDGLRAQPQPEPGGEGAPVAACPGQAAADTRGGRLAQQPVGDRAQALAGLDLHTGDDAERRGVRVEWGDYGPAIRRWEAVHGPAPEPLVRRVDDRGAARVERSRLSALGDGVQVQVGRLVGEHIIGLERRRMSVAAFDTTRRDAQ